ncbi:MAG: homoserine dehydrogenase, partial [Pseudomonadales bacterium]|nr:homoserine dehydrogenase [Pseudomonadales bacterium]
MQSIRLGLCGLGTVGGAVLDVLERNRDEIARRAGRTISVTALGVRRPRPELEAPSRRIERDIMAVAAADDVDVLVELIGGTTLARDLVLRAIEHGTEIFAAAEARGVAVAFEAAVAGGIPLIKAIREGLAANRLAWLAGIVNGTSNFILTEMRSTGREFDDVLAQAQALGYAEADSTFDVDGTDAAHKLTILASIAFGVPLRFAEGYQEGIDVVDRV